MLQKTSQPLHLFWFLERYSFQERKSRLIEHLKMLDICLKSNIVYPHITNLHKVITHQRLLYSTDIPEYKIQLHPRYSGKRNCGIKISTTSDYYKEICKLIEWAQPILMDYQMAFQDLHENCLDQMLLVKENETKTLFWGTIMHNSEELFNFEKVKVNDKNGIIFTVPTGMNNRPEELRYKLISNNIPRSQLDILVKQKLISQLKEDLFL